MKNQFLLLLLLLLFGLSCQKEEVSPVDLLPPATMSGANTFGCLVNGELWKPYTGPWWESLFDTALDVKHDRGWVGCDQLFIGARWNDSKAGINQDFAINVWCPVLGINTITPSKGIFTDFRLRGCTYNYRVDTLSPHTMNITKLDTINFIASGTFSFTAINDDCIDTIRVTEGRFDADSHL